MAKESFTDGFAWIYCWGNNPVRARMKGKRCRIIARGKMNTVLIQTEGGEYYTTSRYAFRKQQTEGSGNERK